MLDLQRHSEAVTAVRRKKPSKAQCGSVQLGLRHGHTGRWLRSPCPPSVLTAAAGSICGGRGEALLPLRSCCSLCPPGYSAAEREKGGSCWQWDPTVPAAQLCPVRAWLTVVAVLSKGRSRGQRRGCARTWRWSRSSDTQSKHRHWANSASSQHSPEPDHAGRSRRAAGRAAQGCGERRGTGCMGSPCQETSCARRSAAIAHSWSR